MLYNCTSKTINQLGGIVRILSVFADKNIYYAKNKSIYSMVHDLQKSKLFLKIPLYLITLEAVYIISEKLGQMIFYYV